MIKRCKFQIRDNLGRLWGQADTTGPLESVCCQGRVLYRLVDGEYIIDEDQPDWMQRPKRKDSVNFRWPSPTYRGDWLVTSRDGQTIESADNRERMLAVAQRGQSRALWEWIGREYTRCEVPAVSRHVQFENAFYRQPVEAREEWLVCSAAGRVWARANRVDSLLSVQASGNRRALWRLVGGEYVLWMVGDKLVHP